MSENTEHQAMVRRIWHAFLSGQPQTPLHRQQRLFRLLPSEARCKLCKVPFQGISGPIVRLLFNKRPSNLNPFLCNVCDDFASKHQGGAEIELSMLFVDVRGSTPLAEQMGLSEYSTLINRFYQAATAVMVRTDALIDKIAGDQVTGLYVPGFAGPQHARRAVEAGQEILRVTGHGGPGGCWIPLGAGVHTGTAFVGSVGSKGGTTDITVLGDAANTAARLSSVARQGEILISESACAAAQLNMDGLEERQLELKGKTKPVLVRVLTA